MMAKIKRQLNKVELPDKDITQKRLFTKNNSLKEIRETLHSVT